MLTADAPEGKFGEQVGQQLECRERLIPGRVLRYRRDLKSRREIELGLRIVTGISEQRAIRAQRWCGDNAGDVRKPPTSLGREQDAHIVQRRIGVDQLLRLRSHF